MAGLRLGFAVATREWAAQIQKVRLPYNVNALSQEVALAVLQEPQVLLGQAAAIRAERGRLFAALAALPGVRAFESHANFVLARVPHAGAVFEGLKARRILVKNLHGWHPLLAQCLRISVGTPEQNARLLAAVERL